MHNLILVLLKLLGIYATIMTGLGLLLLLELWLSKISENTIWEDLLDTSVDYSATALMLVLTPITLLFNLIKPSSCLASIPHYHHGLDDLPPDY